MEVKLLQYGEQGSREVCVDAAEFFIGRESSCDLRLNYSKVSLRHCRIIRRAGRVMVEDLNSTGGTAVNDRDLGREPIEVRDGDQLRVGPVLFRLAIGATKASFTGEALVPLPQSNPLAGFSPAGASDSGIRPASRLAQSAKEILDRIGSRPGRSADGAGSGEGHRGEPRGAVLDVTAAHGCVVARALHRDLSDRREGRHFAEDLGGLIDRGPSRVVLDLTLVESISGQVAGLILVSHRRCLASDGALRLCGVQAAVAETLAQNHALEHLEIHPDERSALAASWDVAPGRAAPAARPAPPPKPTAGEGAPAGLRPVRLIVEVGRAKGQAIEVRTERFLIGRDARCNLRPNTETVSRLHAAIEQRDGVVYVRDLGTKNGTILGDRTLHNQEARAVHGDGLAVGLLRFTLAIGDRPSRGPSKEEDSALALLLGEDGPNPDASTLLFLPVSKAPPPEAAPEPTPPPPPPPRAVDPAADAEALGQIRHLAIEQVGDVLVATVLTPRLDEEDTVGPLRLELQSLLEHARPSRLVLTLARVEFLSNRAGGLILAVSQRIERAGGSLRVCDARPSLSATIEALRLPTLADVYPTLREAMDEPWI